MAYNRVKEILCQQKKTSKQMAQDIGMSEAGLSIALSDKGNPSLDTLRKIAEYLGVTIADIFTDSSKATVTCPRCGASLKISVEENPE